MKRFNLRRYRRHLRVAVAGSTAVIIVAGTLGPVKALAFSGAGAGTSGDPYQITTCAQLQSVDANLTADYKLTQDIDCSGSASLNGGTGFNPIGFGGGIFSGGFDGGGHAILHLDIVTDNTSSHVGIFSEIGNGAYVHNLDVIGGSLTGGSDCGMIAGDMVNGATLTRVSSSANVNCDATNGGGLIGQSYSDVDGTQLITQSYSTGDVTGNGNNYGGLVGDLNYGSVLSDSYYRGDVTIGGTDATVVGGIVGSTSLAEIYNVYAAGTVTGHSYVGGIAGYNSTTDLDYTFSAAHVIADTNFVGPLAGFEQTALAGFNYFDTNLTGFTSDVILNGTPISDSSYFYDHTNPPFNNWDFGGSWLENYQDYPSFAATRPPVITCQAPSSTDNSVGVHCIVGPAGWGIPTWEMRYRKEGATTWIPLTQPDIHEAQVTVTGLHPGTTYQIGFRFTNNSGTSNWAMAEVTTTGTAPPEPVAPVDTASPASQIVQLLTGAAGVIPIVTSMSPTNGSQAVATNSDTAPPDVPSPAAPNTEQNAAQTVNKTAKNGGNKAVFYKTTGVSLLIIISVFVALRLYRYYTVEKHKN